VGTTLLQASQKAHVPHGSACGGVNACSTCHVYVKKGGDLLGEAEDEELDILDKAFDVRAPSRLGCQARIERDGDIEIELTRETVETFYNEHPDERRALEEKAKKADTGPR
ncbi:MAG: 2Fe-2S iron-sulfur cluster-binding protein, partial [Deltaproteobacteria bacterium]